ncbi:unnamed protein product [Lymnaea stagnalis]|uniref:FAS1 domain-containing protein n=1 Tax=Lymnaea stagnalis TaxID=6523 RepID=A0AAV2GYE4_LYMST
MPSLVLSLCLLIAAHSASAQTFPNIVAALNSTGHFTVFSDLLAKSGILKDVNNSLHFTVFAPTDEALAKLPAGTLTAIEGDPAKLADFVGTHVVLTASFHLMGTQQDKQIRSTNNHWIRINTYNILHTVTADGVNITVKNIAVTHGTLHGLDGVLVPPTSSVSQIAFKRADLSNFTSLVVKANLINYLTASSDGTYFIPSNDAISKLSPAALTYLEAHPADLAETIKYHIVRSMTVFSLGLKHSLSMTSADNNHDLLMFLEDGSGGFIINDAKIVEKDIIATDGVIHVIDKVLIPSRVQAHIDDFGAVVG